MHEKYLLAALEDAKLGRGICAPNPSVGAVAVKNSEIIGHAWHRGAGTPHAEKLLIEQLPANLSGVTLYVTLEPCNHQGRTPPCVDAIIQYGFEKVVFAYQDPNPIVVKNNSPELLQSQGITVLHHPLPEIDAFYESYAYWTQTGKPWVTAKIAHTFDGKIAGPKGARISLSNVICNDFTHQNRLLNDIILTTSRTVNQDKPKLNVRLPGITQIKPIAILDRMLSVDDSFLTAQHCYIFYDEQLDRPKNMDNRSYYPVSCVADRLDLHAVIKQLGELGFHSVWVEAGGRLFTAMHQAHLVHRTHIYLVPSVLGDSATPAYYSTDVLDNPKKMRWMPMDDNMLVTLDWE